MSDQWCNTWHLLYIVASCYLMLLFAITFTKISLCMLCQVLWVVVSRHWNATQLLWECSLMVQLFSCTGNLSQQVVLNVHKVWNIVWHTDAAALQVSHKGIALHMQPWISWKNVKLMTRLSFQWRQAEAAMSAVWLWITTAIQVMKYSCRYCYIA